MTHNRQDTFSHLNATFDIHLGRPPKASALKSGMTKTETFNSVTEYL